MWKTEKLERYGNAFLLVLKRKEMGQRARETGDL